MSDSDCSYLIPVLGELESGLTWTAPHPWTRLLGFLDFVDRRGLLRSDAPAGAHVTVGNVDAYYIAELKDRVGS